jgi:hypothetical protein
LILEFSFSNTWNRQFFDFGFFFSNTQNWRYSKKSNTPTLEQTPDGYQGDYAGSYWLFSKTKKTKESALITYNYGSRKIEKIKTNNCI